MANPFRFVLTGLLLNLWAALDIRASLRASKPSMFREQIMLQNKIEILKIKARINTLVIVRTEYSQIPWSWASLGEAV